MIAPRFGTSKERALVRIADALSTPMAWWPNRRKAKTTERVLLLRLERIGDLLMTLEAIADLTRAMPSASIDVAVGSWNAELAAMIPGVHATHVADVPWLSRGEGHASWPAVLSAARDWRRHRYDLVVNFEPDIRSNGLAWLTGAPERVGYATGGGRAFLTRAVSYDVTRHVSANARALVAEITGTPPAGDQAGPRLAVPADARARAVTRLGDLPRPWIGIHASGGRESKQWHLDRFAAVGRRLAVDTGGTLVLTGGPADVDLVGAVRHQLGDAPCVITAGRAPIADTVAVIGSLDVFVTGDTGPMHIAGAVGTPVVALFGPSDPVRYGPRSTFERVVRVDLPCSPCGQVRLPPVRCRGHVPDCMDGILVERVVADVHALLDESRERRRSRFA